MEKALLTGVRTALALALLAPLIVMVPPLPVTYYPFVVGKALYSRALIEIAFGSCDLPPENWSRSNVSPGP